MIHKAVIKSNLERFTSSLLFEQYKWSFVQRFGETSLICDSGMFLTSVSITQMLIYMKKFHDFIVHTGEKSVPTIWILKYSSLFSMLILLFLLWMLLGDTFPAEHNEDEWVGGAGWRLCRWGSHLVAKLSHVFRFSPPFFKSRSVSLRKIEGTLRLEGKGNN